MTQKAVLQCRYGADFLEDFVIQCLLRRGFAYLIIAHMCTPIAMESTAIDLKVHTYVGPKRN